MRKELKELFDCRDTSRLDREEDVMSVFIIRGFKQIPLSTSVAISTDGVNRYVRFKWNEHLIVSGQPVSAAHCRLIPYMPELFYVALDSNNFKFYWK